MRIVKLKLSLGLNKDEREIDEGTGNEGGSTEGSFDAWWQGSTLYGQNNAVQHNSDYEVDGKYILGHALPPENEPVTEYNRPENIYIWHVNYHPDGGQLFFPTTKSPFYFTVSFAW